MGLRQLAMHTQSDADELSPRGEILFFCPPFSLGPLHIGLVEFSVGNTQDASAPTHGAKGGEVRLKKCDSKRATQKCAVAASTNEIENALATRIVSAATT